MFSGPSNKSLNSLVKNGLSPATIKKYKQSKIAFRAHFILLYFIKSCHIDLSSFETGIIEDIVSKFHGFLNFKFIRASKKNLVRFLDDGRTVKLDYDPEKAPSPNWGRGKNVIITADKGVLFTSRLCLVDRVCPGTRLGKSATKKVEAVFFLLTMRRAQIEETSNHAFVGFLQW